MMRSFKKIKSDLGNGSHSITGAIPDVITRAIPDESPKANTDDGTTPANADDAEQPEESNDSSGTINWDDLEPYIGAINLDLNKVHGIPGN